MWPLPCRTAWRWSSVSAVHGDTRQHAVLHACPLPCGAAEGAGVCAHPPTSGQHRTGAGGLPPLETSLLAGKQTGPMPRLEQVLSRSPPAPRHSLVTRPMVLALNVPVLSHTPLPPFYSVAPEGPSQPHPFLSFSNLNPLCFFNAMDPFDTLKATDPFSAERSSRHEFSVQSTSKI